MKEFGKPIFGRAIVRQPGPGLGAGETTASLGAPDHGLALEQFAAYVAALQDSGLQVQVLPPLPGFPDAHFVEDTAVVTAQVAVVSRPGAGSRRGEEKHMQPHLAEHRPLARIEPPGTLDGGDILMVGNHFLVGVSERTNRAGAGQLGRILEAHGHTWEEVPVDAGLHLKSSVNQIGNGRLLVTSAFADQPALQKFDRVVVPDEEAYACNTLLVNGHLLTPAGFPRTCALLQKEGLPLITLETSEFRKMDGGLTCLSLRF